MHHPSPGPHSQRARTTRVPSQSSATVQITSGSASHLLRASTLRALRCGRASDQIAIDQTMPDDGHSRSARASNASLGRRA
ncbi:hypothetical protein BGY98DRAFT_1036744 [Russula aff. rugulosa BPL654]|nr:hypothetical protein BGY98DRAFT_1036744 [Russula aff. rugulosa BPL654]